MGGAGTLSVRGDLKGMSPKFLRGASLTGYGCSLNVGIGIPIPILNEEMAHFTAVSDDEIFVPVVDYGGSYPERRRRGDKLCHLRPVQERGDSRRWSKNYHRSAFQLFCGP